MVDELPQVTTTPAGRSTPTLNALSSPMMQTDISWSNILTAGRLHLRVLTRFEISRTPLAKPTLTATTTTTTTQ